VTGVKKYLQPKDMVLNAIHDLADMQKAKTLFCDSPRGVIGIKVTMYAAEWEYLFTVSDIGGNRSSVTIDLLGDPPELKRLIDHELSLLDYVLLDRTRIELTEVEEHGGSIQAK